MKDAKSLITHLTHTPKFMGLQKQRCYGRLKKLLPPYLQDATLFMYQRDKTLFFVLNHQAFLMEFNYKLSLIKELLNILRQECPVFADVQHVKGFVTNRVKKESKAPESVPRYSERSSGEFAITSKDCDIREKLQELQRSICKQKS